MNHPPIQLKAVTEWLEENNIEILAISNVGDVSLSVQVRLFDGTHRKLHLSWELLRAFNPQQIRNYLNTHHFADELMERDLYITRPNWPNR